MPPKAFELSGQKPIVSMPSSKPHTLPLFHALSPPPLFIYRSPREVPLLPFQSLPNSSNLEIHLANPNHLKTLTEPKAQIHQKPTTSSNNEQQNGENLQTLLDAQDLHDPLRMRQSDLLPRSAGLGYLSLSRACGLWVCQG